MSLSSLKGTSYETLPFMQPCNSQGPPWLPRITETGFFPPKGEAMWTSMEIGKPSVGIGFGGLLLPEFSLGDSRPNPGEEVPKRFAEFASRLAKITAGAANQHSGLLGGKPESWLHLRLDNRMKTSQRKVLQARCSCCERAACLGVAAHHEEARLAGCPMSPSSGKREKQPASFPRAVQRPLVSLLLTWRG